MRVVPEHFRAWIEVDLGRLERNLRNLRHALPPHLRYIAVVKADAYGHGLPAVVTRLMRCGADAFAVANLAEAAAIREIGHGWPILVLSSILPAEDPQVLTYQATPVISSAGELARMAALGEQAGHPWPIHLKIDTGMGRVGVWHQQATALYRAIRAEPRVRLEGICTHFAMAGLDPLFTAHQRQTFLKLLAGWDDLDPSTLLIHADNSAGLESFPADGPLNGVRIGLRQFGVGPYPRSVLGAAELGPVFSFHTRVGLVKELPAGTGISYGRTHVLERPTRIAVLTAGYGDGLPTSLSNVGAVLIRGQRCPILGRVTMDQTMVNVQHLPEVQPGDIATLIGRQDDEEIRIEAFARQSGQVTWEVLCGITARVQRVYRRDTGV